jgi:hypothetical protein
MVQSRLDPEGNVVVAIKKDSGSGIREDKLPRPFEPFFTTCNSGTVIGVSVAASAPNEDHGMSGSDRFGRRNRLARLATRRRTVLVLGFTSSVRARVEKSFADDEFAGQAAYKFSRDRVTTVTSDPTGPT